MMQISARIEKDMYQQIKDLANKEDRSINKTIIRLLKTALEQTEESKKEE